MYHFRPLTPQDRPLFDTWLSQPHIQGWWGDAATEWALIEQDWAQGQALTDMRIVELDGTAFAYIQDYDAHVYAMPHYTRLPRGTRAIDTFLGDPAYLSRGHAAGYLRQRAQELCAAGAPLVVVDPEPENHRAVAAYRKAGFQGECVLPSEDGTPALILTYPEQYPIQAPKDPQ